jgi:hypothetical protein
LSNSKAARRKGLADVVKDMQNKQKRESGISRQNFSGLGSADFGGVTASASSGAGSTNSIQSHSSTDLDGVLQTVGDTMVGPISFYLKSATVANGVINVSKGNAYSSRVIVVGQGGAADDLEVILGASHAGQILFFQPIQAITLQSYLKTATAWSGSSVSYSVGDVVLDASQRYTCYTAHTSSSATDPSTGADWETVWYRNNIRVTGATERVVAIDEIIMLQYDSTDSVWTILSGGGVSGGGWVGTATSNLDMAGYSIQFDTDNDTYMVSSVDDYLQTMVGGSVRMSITNSVIDFHLNLDMNDYDIQNIDILDFKVTGQRFNSTNSSIQYEVPSGDVHKFLVSSATKMTLSTTELLMAYGCNIKLPYGSLVDFNASVATTRTGGSAAALPSNPVGYIYVKVVGVDRYIPFYS